MKWITTHYWMLSNILSSGKYIHCLSNEYRSNDYISITTFFRLELCIEIQLIFKSLLHIFSSITKRSASVYPPCLFFFRFCFINTVDRFLVLFSLNSLLSFYFSFLNWTLTFMSSCDLYLLNLHQNWI